MLTCDLQWAKQFFYWRRKLIHSNLNETEAYCLNKAFNIKSELTANNFDYDQVLQSGKAMEPMAVFINVSIFPTK
jgi:hypothetical protein